MKKEYKNDRLSLKNSNLKSCLFLLYLDESSPTFMSYLVTKGKKKSRKTSRYTFIPWYFKLSIYLIR